MSDHKNTAGVPAAATRSYNFVVEKLGLDHP
jgi:hypothetical protein